MRDDWDNNFNIIIKITFKILQKQTNKQILWEPILFIHYI